MIALCSHWLLLISADVCVAGTVASYVWQFHPLFGPSEDQAWAPHTEKAMERFERGVVLGTGTFATVIRAIDKQARVASLLSFRMHVTHVDWLSTSHALHARRLA